MKYDLTTPTPLERDLERLALRAFEDRLESPPRIRWFTNDESSPGGWFNASNGAVYIRHGMGAEATFEVLCHELHHVRQHQSEPGLYGFASWIADLPLDDRLRAEREWAYREDGCYFVAACLVDRYRREVRKLEARHRTQQAAALPDSYERTCLCASCRTENEIAFRQRAKERT